MTDKPYHLYDIRNGSAFVCDSLQYITRGYVRRNGSVWIAATRDYTDNRTVPVRLTVDLDLSDDELRAHCIKLLKEQGMGRASDRIKDFVITCGPESVQPIFRTRDDAATWVVLNN